MPTGSGHQAQSGHQVYGDREAYAGHDAYTGYEVHRGHEPFSGQETYAGHAGYEPYGGVPPDSWRPAHGTHAVGPAAPQAPRAPLYGAQGVPGARSGRTAQAAPDAPTEPRLPRPRQDTLVAANPVDGPDDADDVRGRGSARGLDRPGDGIAGGRGTGGRAEARRAARRKRLPERPESLRRLLPQALVVAFLAGGTSAFVANDKAIELSVDGRPRTLHTFADDVSELLADEGVKVGAHDMVAPARGTALASGDEVAVRYGRPVHLTIDGERRRVWTTAHTVDGALGQLGVRAEGAHLSASRSRRIGPEGLALDVRTERAVTIMADGRARTIRTNAASVAEAVREAGITLHGQDMTSVPAGSFPRDGQTVSVLRVTGAREVREERIPFEVRRADDASLFEGVEFVEKPGRYGARRLTYSLRTVNGVKQRPRLEGSEVVRQPQDRLVRVGTKPHPPARGGADHLNWAGLAACESGGRPGAVDPSGTYGGLYQFDTRTWHTLGGTGRPQDAPAAEQTRRAKKLYMRRGTSPWPHCGPRLHG
ncbi:ubiquitin-like domain-containing protein [Streptomyces sp. BF23-18]|uniref:ubiquitin-like domain-containing protein n=1 Tax=Streptomyces sp. BF23-18 TaxID=3240282 RepID=UPI0034E5C58F